MTSFVKIGMQQELGPCIINKEVSIRRSPGLCLLLLALLFSMKPAHLQAAPDGTEQSVPKIELEYLTQVRFSGPNHANLEPFSYTGRHMIGRIMAGSASGPLLNGEILPVGEDWALFRPDGTLEIDVRTLLRTEDGALIRISWQGRWHGTKEVRERILAGEDVDPNEYYLRVTPYFETVSPKYAWLNNVVAIGHGKVDRGAGAIISIFLVK